MSAPGPSMPWRRGGSNGSSCPVRRKVHHPHPAAFAFALFFSLVLLASEISGPHGLQINVELWELDIRFRPLVELRLSLAALPHHLFTPLLALGAATSR